MAQTSTVTTAAAEPDMTDPLVAAQMQAEVNPEDLIVPYSREEADEAEEEQAPEDTPDDGGDDEDEQEDASEPTSFVTAQDPGEYQPKDYSFDIEIAGKTHHVDSAEKAAELGEEFAEEMNAKQIFALINKGSKIEVKQERDKEEWEAKKKTFDEQTAVEAGRQQTINNFAAEFAYLEGKGLLPKVAAEFKKEGVNWENPEVAGQPGVKEQLALLNYMVKENRVRAKAGIRQLTSVVDAFNAMRTDDSEKARVTNRKQAGEARKAASSRVAATAPASSAPYIPAGIAVGRTGVFDRGNTDWS